MIFPPPGPVVSIVVDGVSMRSYRAPYLSRGRVMAPVVPFVIGVCASVEYDRGTILVRRGDRFALAPAAAFVPLGPLLRTLGLAVAYDARRRRVEIRTPGAVFATPTPFNPAVPRSAPSEVFTPAPLPTPRPIVSGKPQPRRTPLPLSAVRARPSPDRSSRDLSRRAARLRPRR